MNRPPVLPIALAAGLHAALLLGFPSSSPTVAAAPRAKSPPDTRPLPHVLDLLPPDPVDLASPEPASNAPPHFRSPEPLPIARPSAFELEVKRETAPPPDGPVTTIPRSPGTGGFAETIGVPEGTGTIHRPGDLDATPRTRFQAAPIYPHEKRREGAEGEVLVEFTVDESGTVLAPRVVRSTDRAFEEATLRAVARWRFEPGRRGGVVVRFRMVVPVVFRLGHD